jgi:hypothetical protein
MDCVYMEQAILETLITEGLSTRGIAKRVGSSQTNVRHFLAKYGLKTRKRVNRGRHGKHVVAWRQRAKKRAVEYKGGKCQACGYCRCIRALKFHHLDPDKKDFAISSVSRSWEVIRKELDKCILVCGNCHDEIHDGLIDVTLFTRSTTVVRLPVKERVASSNLAG